MLHSAWYTEYDTTEVLEGLLLLGASTPDPHIDRRADLETALKHIHRTHATVCLLSARGHSGAKIGPMFNKCARTGQRMAQRALEALRTEMNRPC